MENPQQRSMTTSFRDQNSKIMYKKIPLVVENERNEGAFHMKEQYCTLNEQNMDTSATVHEIGHQNNPDAIICPSKNQTTTQQVTIHPKEHKTEENNSYQTSPLIYKLTDTPPFYSIPFFVLQQGILAISTPLLTTFLVSKAICADDDDEIKTRILSATFFMIGLSTFTMVTLGVRLPIFQGPNFTYILPILTMINLKEFSCPAVFHIVDPGTNATISMVRISNDTVITKDDLVHGRINEFAGSLIAVGLVHFLIGVTGLVGFIQRYVGPITIVPIVLLFGIQIHTVVLDFASTHWGTSALTACIALIFGVYLEKCSTPVPWWSPSKGFFIAWLSIHNVLSIFISIAVGWLVCFALTQKDLLTDDRNDKEFLARTDSRIQVFHNINWFIVPYPGQFGMPRFNLTAAISFFIATLMSILDSIGDYSASARICCAPQPPRFALNRGIAVEGLMVFLGGAFGCGHGTVSFGENIGAMRISRVVSIAVFQLCGIMYIIFAFFGKLGAFFITIPYSVMGGSQIITFGILIGVILSYLQYVDLNSTRNLSILGITLMLGLMMPEWVSQTTISTGNHRLNAVIRIFLTNPSFVGGFTAFVLDNTIPGSRKERGIAFQISQLKNGDDERCVNDRLLEEAGTESFQNNAERSENRNNDILLHGREIYRLPWLSDKFRGSRLARFLPIFDYTITKKS